MTGETQPNTMMRKETALVVGGALFVFFLLSNPGRERSGENIAGGITMEENPRSLLFNWGSKKSKYDGQRGDEYCYNVNVGSGTLCCGAPYDLEKGFGNGAVCYLEKSFDCHDLRQAVFVADGDITMDIDMIGKRAFPNIQTGNGFYIGGDPSSGLNSAPYDYTIRPGVQNGLSTKLTGNAHTLMNKSFLVSGWDESQTPSDHEIEWAGPSPVGIGGESFAAPAVIMKAGKGAMVYLDDNDGVLHASGLRTPIDPEDGINLKTEHVEFCFDYTPAATATPTDAFAVFRDGDEETTEETTTDEEEAPPPPPPEAEEGTKSPPGIKGDPHIKKWDGTQYDFHGGCDLVMLQNPGFNNGQGLHIHIRTKIEHWWSYIESAVIKIGDDTLEIKGGVEDRAYWVNKRKGRRFRASRNLPFTIGGFHGRFRAINDILTQFKIYLPNEQNLVIKSAKNMLRVDLENCNVDDFGGSLGLMGTFGEGLMLGRDNKTVIEDPTDFGMEWQVLNTEPQLFHDVVGPQHPQKCAMPTTKTFLKRQRKESEARRMLVEGITREEAEAACKSASRDEFTDCVYDVMATDDKDVASAYN